ncbi:hypothetical protein G4Y79_20285 [Phototrophicus methaneseepsis]|uniref:Uncharacterized protein n=1 Tax=Phototrophicus methaneseepsis TaxID=2710758 RepID=A0A7S8IEN6_9CHLR|nr:hypothetical protein [Phototrophicus methaneseepsis]QPC82003.1 hypothetical protein G4Y79_20285 [Phototrophicus methaneseepsis]
MLRSFRRAIFISVIGTLLTVGTVLAQQTQCYEFVQRAFASVDEYCSTTGRNEACYGNVALDAEPQVGVNEFHFSSVGDIENVTNIQSLKLYDLDESVGVWGIAFMRLQANLPDTLPGQNATVILFGDVSLENNDDLDSKNLQAFYLQTGLGRPSCSEVPQSGLLIQTPDGVEEVTFNINGVDVTLGSTVLFQAQPNAAMTITTVEGSAVVAIDDKNYTAIAGTRIHIPVDENLKPIAAPTLPEAYTEEDVQALPVSLLERPIEVAAPMAQDVLQRVRDRLSAGLVPCGEDGLPACDSMKPVVNRGNHLAHDDDWTPGEPNGKGPDGDGPPGQNNQPTTPGSSENTPANNGTGNSSNGNSGTNNNGTGNSNNANNNNGNGNNGNNANNSNNNNNDSNSNPGNSGNNNSGNNNMGGNSNSNNNSNNGNGPGGNGPPGQQNSTTAPGNSENTSANNQPNNGNSRSDSGNQSAADSGSGSSNPGNSDTPGNDNNPDNSNNPGNSGNAPHNNDNPNNSDTPGNNDNPDNSGNNDTPGHSDNPGNNGNSSNAPHNNDNPNNSDAPGNSDNPGNSGKSGNGKNP